MCFLFGHLAEVFKDTAFFPIALTLIGGLIIYLGTLWQKNEAKTPRKSQCIFPRAFRELIQARHDLG